MNPIAKKIIKCCVAGFIIGSYWAYPKMIKVLTTIQSIEDSRSERNALSWHQGYCDGSGVN